MQQKKIIKLSDLDPKKKATSFCKLEFPPDLSLRERMINCSDVYHKLKEKYKNFDCVGSTVHFGADDDRGQILWTDLDLEKCTFMLIYYTNEENKTT